MAEFDFSQIVKWLGSDVHVTGTVKGFKQDSRDIVPGDLFFAQKGEKVDGHAYLKEIAEKGAVGAVVSKDYLGEAFGLKLIPVGDVVASLHDLARTVQSLRKTLVVGVTGSVGKTTTKEFIATLLEGKFHVEKTPGNANSQVGVPLSILNSEGKSEVFVMEMGMSLPGELQKLVSIAPPVVSIVTKIALSHAEYFPGGIEEIADQKMEILSHPSTKVGILNQDVTGYSSADKGSCAKKTYGLGPDCHFQLFEDGSSYYVQEGEERTDSFALPFSASHLLENFIGAYAVARSMGMQALEIIPQVGKLSVYKRRFERVERNGIVFINDSYNANPTSMVAALTNLPAPQGGGKRVAVLGAMKELGIHAKQGHLDVAKVASANVDHLLCFGEECLSMIAIFEKEGKPAEYFEKFEDLKCRVFELSVAGDVVLLKGSNSKKLWLVLE